VWRRLSQTRGLGGACKSASPALCLIALKTFSLYSGRRQCSRFVGNPFPGPHLLLSSAAVHYNRQLLMPRMRVRRVIWMPSLGIVPDGDTYPCGIEWAGRVAAGDPAWLAARTWLSAAFLIRCTKERVYVDS